MDEREALLRAVCENPDDDTLRLVFADWLQENGEEVRAEFIRVQIALDRGTCDPAEVMGLERHESRLMLRGWGWRHELAGADQLRFERGFVAHAHFADGPAFLAALDRTPLRSASIAHVVDLAQVLDAARARRLEEVDLGEAAVGDDDLELLIGGSWAVDPTHLILPWTAGSGDRQEVARERFGRWVEFDPPPWYREAPIPRPVRWSQARTRGASGSR